MSASTTTFTQNERVLCYHGPMIYEAKILKIDNWDETTTKTGTVGPHFFVHYKGWKQTWDEWVPAARLLKYNETNLELAKTLKNASTASTSKSTNKKSGTGGGTGTGGTASSRRKDGRGTKRGRDEDDSNRRPDMKLNVPEILKVLLVDDWEAVTKNNQLVTLPRSPTVAEILHDFQEFVLSQPQQDSDLRDPPVLLPTVISGLQVYFDRSLGANLLYRFERPQYAEIRKRFVTGPSVKVGTEKEMSAVYGAEHLLRMIVSLPQLVSTSSMDPESVGIVKEYAHELMAYMVKERERLFQRDYDNASPQYQNVSRS
ncbi:MRG-domain-containing protein [Thelephora terrestris]|uniref:Chromatin modification-related protein EAF3 n=1 Tax=Thelephora terrestris TaxID=56493 RepID=A0A9P6HAX3_9AGAM|nr:MRG-domain-containing protein [Thelephora terrestris]